MDLKVLQKAIQGGFGVEVFLVQPGQLLVDVLLGEHEHLELLRFNQVRAFCHLFDEHT